MDKKYSKEILDRCEDVIASIKYRKEDSDYNLSINNTRFDVFADLMYLDFQKEAYTIEAYTCEFCIEMVVRVNPFLIPIMFADLLKDLKKCLKLEYDRVKSGKKGTKIENEINIESKTINKYLLDPNLAKAFMHGFKAQARISRKAVGQYIDAYLSQFTKLVDARTLKNIKKYWISSL